MKKMMVLTVLLVFAVVSVAQADIRVNWVGFLGFYDHTETPGAPADPGGYILADGGSAPVYLIWSPDNVIENLLNISAVSEVRPVIDGGNDIVLGTFNGANSPYGDYDAGVNTFLDVTYGETLTTGYIYARIFEDALADLVYYNDGPIVAAAPYVFTGSEPPVDYNHNAGDPAAGDQCNQQLTVIPEPSTVLLSLLGLGVIMVRRFRK